MNTSIVRPVLLTLVIAGAILGYVHLFVPAPKSRSHQYTSATDNSTSSASQTETIERPETTESPAFDDPVSATEFSFVEDAMPYDNLPLVANSKMSPGFVAGTDSSHASPNFETTHSSRAASDNDIKTRRGGISGTNVGGPQGGSRSGGSSGSGAATATSQFGTGAHFKQEDHSGRYWLDSNGIRHNSSCRYYRNVPGRECTRDEGRPHDRDSGLDSPCGG